MSFYDGEFLPRMFVAMITQVGAAAPTIAPPLINTANLAPVFSRSAAGSFTIVATGRFTLVGAASTFLAFCIPTLGQGVQFSRTDVNTLAFTTFTAAGVANDGSLTNAPFVIMFFI